MAVCSLPPSRARIRLSRSSHFSENFTEEESSAVQNLFLKKKKTRLSIYLFIYFVWDTYNFSQPQSCVFKGYPVMKAKKKKME